jgi:putative phosphoesterase
MRILIVSDIHANKTPLEHLSERVDKTVFLGDAVDYGPCPSQCVAWVRDRADFAVRGNHDNAVANNRDPRCTPAFREMAEVTCVRHRMMLEPEDKSFLQSLPVECYFRLGGADFYAVHAAPSDPLFKYLPRDVSDEDLAAEVGHVETDVILLGHTHFQFIRPLGRKLVLNPGSLGQPKDGDRRGAYAIWEDGDVSLHRCDYPVEQTIRQLEEMRLPEHVFRGLSIVLWTGKG